MPAQNHPAARLRMPTLLLALTLSAPLAPAQATIPTADQKTLAKQRHDQTIDRAEQEYNAAVERAAARRRAAIEQAARQLASDLEAADRQPGAPARQPSQPAQPCRIANPTVLFGAPAKAPQEYDRVIFLIDRSGSMITTFDIVARAVLHHIAELPESTEFAVIFFASGDPIVLDAKQFLPATPANKQKAAALLEDITPEGLTQPARAIQLAFQLANAQGQTAQAIYLLTDGEFDADAVNLATALNRRLPEERRAIVNTIAFLSEEGKLSLQKLASENNGHYRFVSRDHIGR